jgi:hypothetical protein
VTKSDALLKPARIPPDRPLGGRQYQLKSIPAARFDKKGAEKLGLPVSEITMK